MFVIDALGVIGALGVILGIVTGFGGDDAAIVHQSLSPAATITACGCLGSGVLGTLGKQFGGHLDTKGIMVSPGIGQLGWRRFVGSPGPPGSLELPGFPGGQWLGIGSVGLLRGVEKV